MQLFPTRPAVHVALAALGTVGLGVVLRAPAIVGWGGAMIAGLAFSRAMTKVAIVRLRLSGLEMLWHTDRVQRLSRGDAVTLTIELRNRDTRAVRYRAARALASRELQVSVDPALGVVPPGAAVKLILTVRAPRVGTYCVHGLSLEARGPSSLFEVPLAFANPLGVEVLPRPLMGFISSARGGRSRLFADAGAAARRPGQGSELYELREHVAGDPFKHIAWKASARRGRLFVREFEREDRDVVWLVLDADVSMLGGPLGRAPIDAGIDQLAALARRHLARGDRVGVAVAGVPSAFWLHPSRGPGHGLRVSRALTRAASALDAGRSEDDEIDVARRVLEHLRFLDAAGAAGLSEGQLDRLAAVAEAASRRAPFDEPAPLAANARERTLRRYLACFGISSPPRSREGDARSEAAVAEALERALGERPRPSLAYVWGRPPESPSTALTSSVRKLLRRGVAVRWLSTMQEDALSPAHDEVAQAVFAAMALRTRVARERGERALGAIGVRVLRNRPKRFA
jgi:uncharacterized protein (DUF58 family)